MKLERIYPSSKKTSHLPVYMCIDIKSDHAFLRCGPNFQGPILLFN